MAKNNFRLHCRFNSLVKLILGIFFLLIPSLGFGQNNGSSIKTPEDKNAPVELLDETNAEERWQLLEWKEENPRYVMYYEIFIEAQNSKTNEWGIVRRLTTENNQPSVVIEPKLPVGFYRYKVVTIDLIGLESAESEWVDFAIYQAFEPEVNSVSVNLNKTNTIYFDEYNDGVITINGKNLFETPKDQGELSFTTYKLFAGKKLYLNLEPAENKDNKQLVFNLDMDTIETGRYHFVATDASGLKNQLNNKSLFIVKFKKAMDFDVAGGYQLPIEIFDGTFSEYFNSNIFPYSLMGKITFIPFKKRVGYFGLGLNGFVTRMYNQEKTYSIAGNQLSGYLNFVYQYSIKSKKTLKQIMTFELHGGAGFELFNNYRFKFAHNIVSDPYSAISPAVDGGVAIQVYTLGRLYLEANTDFCMSFLSDMSYGSIRPGLLVGWQF